MVCKNVFLFRLNDLYIAFRYDLNILFHININLLCIKLNLVTVAAHEGRFVKVH